MFLSLNGVAFSEPCDDPWFAAHTDGIAYEDADSTFPTYNADDPARVLGCVDQTQFCNPNLDPSVGCSTLTGDNHAVNLTADLWTTEQQKIAFEWFVTGTAPQFPRLVEYFRHLGPMSLAAQSKNAFSWQGALPDNQWQLELEGWFYSTLALWQSKGLQLATSYRDPEFRKYQRTPVTEDEVSLCRSMVGPPSAVPPSAR